MAAPKKTDTPKVHATLAKITAEVHDVEEFMLGLPNGKRVTFPDIYAQESEAAENLVRDLATGVTSNWEVLDRWLSKEDAAALRAEKLSLRELIAVLEAAQHYYETSYGTPGEEDASHN